jgi:hypothetical protein
VELTFYALYTLHGLFRLVAVGGESPESHRGFVPGSGRVGFVAGKWHQDKFSEYFGFYLAISFHRCSPVQRQSHPIDVNNVNVYILSRPAVPRLL